MIMAIAMVAMLAFGGTYAYFTATTAGGTASVTTGVVQLTAGETVSINVTDLMPGDTAASGTLALSSVANDGAYVFVKVASESASVTGLTFKFEGSESAKWTELETGYYFYTGTSSTAPAVVGQDGSAAEVDLSMTVSATLAWDAPNASQNQTVSYTLTAYSIQATNLDAHLDGKDLTQAIIDLALANHS